MISIKKMREGSAEAYFLRRIKRFIGTKLPNPSPLRFLVAEEETVQKRRKKRSSKTATTASVTLGETERQLGPRKGQGDLRGDHGRPFV